MAIRKRKGSDVWHIDIRKPGGGRLRQTTGTTDRKEAQEFHDKVKHELWRVAKLGERPRRTFDEAALRLLRECEGTTDYTNKCLHIRHWRKHFSGRYLDSLTRDEIFDALPQYNALTKDLRPLANSTKSLYLGTMRVMFNKAVHDWEWIDKAPKLSDLPGKPKRIRWITKEEAQRLISAITVDWLRDVAILGFATGLRRANLLNLEWSQVDLVNRRAWIHPDQAKARKPIGVPLNDDAVAAIRRWIGKHPTHVFVRKGHPIQCWSSEQWDRQCARAGIKNFRFHDVRHTWASWHVQAGTPLNRLMELGGWSKYEMVLRYAHLAPDHLAAHASAVTIWSQPQGSDHEAFPQTLAA
ncbi:site-specific integrase [Burkholderia multivorans]|nr:site-specific integrase [Burkholderia multivorans]MDN8092107.1 site-specific integrase [Burkholderia multivorans]MDN8097414.1 site-specific integrase [Burkholderia multivorans]MDN8109064.1 site-specific integrase [Burkholderia multivorans]MDN8125122.1 site-specific integrase [Burkholderia multivorans]MDN8132330.1 site-specific integrase [Burkholderia multivorans]